MEYSCRYTVYRRFSGNAIPPVSSVASAPIYSFGMATKTKYAWEGWGGRFKKAAAANNWTIKRLAGRKDAVAKEAALRHYSNGTRDIKLRDFFKLCEQAEVDPHDILFGKLALTSSEKKVIANEIVEQLDTIRSS